MTDRRPDTAREASTAIRALAYRASTTADAGIRSAALEKAKAIADDVPMDVAPGDVVENAAAIAGLVAVSNARGEAKYLDPADKLFDLLSSDFDATAGVFRSKSVYNVADDAWIVGGLNFLGQKGSQTNRGAARDMLGDFVKQSGQTASTEGDCDDWRIYSAV